MSAKGKFSKEQRDEILRSIAGAEGRTSGEIRLFVEDVCGENVLDRAAFIFQKLKMHRTKERNAVLFYLALESRQFAILGDTGINAKVPADFWNGIKQEMQKHFREGDFVKGLSTGIHQSGEALLKFFPHDKDRGNELPDDIVYGKN